MNDLSGQIKTAVLRNLIDDPDIVSALGSADYIYSDLTPTSPPSKFIRLELQEVEPYNDSCGEGSEVGIRIHVFTNDEDTAASIARRVTSTLGSASGFLFIDWQRTQLVPDRDEADVKHVAIDFNAAMTA